MDTQDWSNQIDNTTRDFQQEFGSLSESELNWKPNPHIWSVAQNIDHLIVINKTYHPIIEAVRQNKYELPWIGRINFMVNFFGNFILKSVSPDRRKRMKTFPLWEPSSSTIDGVLQKFVAHQEEIKSLIATSSDLLDQGKVISSPANKNIVYTLKCAFDIIVTHERRHLEQAKEVNRLRLQNEQ